MSRSDRDATKMAVLWKRLKEQGDPLAREKIIVEYADLVKYAANRVAVRLPASVDTDDLTSYGVFGLIDAVEKFDPDRGIKFESYALSRIRGSIIDGLRAADWVPRSVRQKAKDLERTISALESNLGRTASDTEIAAAMGLSANDLSKLLDEVQATSVTSLDEFWSESYDGDKLRLADMIENVDAENPTAGLEFAAMKDTLSAAIDALPDRERLVVSLYYYEGLTLKEIGEVLSVTESRISQVHTKAISRLRGRLERMRESVL